MPEHGKLQKEILL